LKKKVVSSVEVITAMLIKLPACGLWRHVDWCTPSHCFTP